MTCPTTGNVDVSGWLASQVPIDSVRLARPDGRTSEPIPLVGRPDINRLHPRAAHISGFSGRMPSEWVSDGEIEVVYACGGKEERYRRTLVYAVDMDAKSRKLRRIAPLLRADRHGRLNAHHFDFLNDDIRRKFNLIDVDAVSSHGYDEPANDLIRRHAEGMILDAGAGNKAEYHANVVNLEIVPYPSTDVLGVGEDLPFVDNAFDAVFSLAVLEHVKDPFACARELARVLKPGGTLYAVVPLLQPYHGYPHHYYNMTHQGLSNLFEGMLEVKEQRVPESGHPVYTLWWLLRDYGDALPPEEREKFHRMTVADFLPGPEILRKESFAMKLPEPARMKLAATTMLLATKP